MSPDKLVYMANQIGKYFASQKAATALPGIADHIKKFGIRGCAMRFSLIWRPAARASTPWCVKPSSN
jgi:hypothetical protein